MPIPAPFPTYTPTWHNEPYDAIDPSRPELSVKGKSVIITGAGTGIGAATVQAFAEAGAAKIALIARRTNILNDTKNAIQDKFPGTKFTVHGANVTDLAALNRAAAEVGAWDVLVLNAAYAPAPGSVLDSDVEDWWRGYKVNVKGVVLTLQAFMPSKTAHAKVIGVSSAIIALPSSFVARTSSYASSKIAMAKLLEIFAAENPDTFVTTLHPGVVYDGSEMAQKSEMKDLPSDNVRLPAQYIVWLASEEASFLAGKFTYCNWDVEELKERAKEIGQSPILYSGVLGFPWLGPQTQTA